MVLRDVHVPTPGTLHGTGALQVCGTEGPEWEITLEHLGGSVYSLGPYKKKAGESKSGETGQQKQMCREWGPNAKERSGL